MANTLNSKKKVSITPEALKSNKKTSTTAAKLQKQIANYETRLDSIGKKKDKRNAVEKFLGLPEDQNVLFDIFEIIGRPQQALFGAVDSALTEEEDPIEGAIKGIRGAKTTSGGKILRDLGMEGSGKFSLFDKDSYEEASLSDVLGFGLDLFADPVDLALWGATAATGGAAAPAAIGKTAADAARKTAKVADTAIDISKAAKATKTGVKAAKIADNASDIIKGAKIANKASDITRTARVADNALDILKGADNIVDAGKAAQKTRITFAPFQKGSKSTLELAMGGLGKGVKKVAKVGDNVIEKVLGKLDDASKLKYADAVEKYGSRAAKEMYKISDNLGSYKQLKKALSSAVDYTKALPGDILKKVTRNANAEDVARIQMEVIQNNASKDIQDLARKTLQKQGIEITEEALQKETKKIAENLTHFYETKYTLKKSVNEILSDISSNSKTFKASKKEIKALDDVLSQIPLAKGTYEITDEGIKFTDKFIKNKNTILKDTKYKNLLENTKLVQPKKYTEEQLLEFKKMSKDKDFMELVDKHKKDYKEYGKIMKNYDSNNLLDFSEITDRPGYVKKAKGNIDKDYENFIMGKSTSSDINANKSRKYASSKEAGNILEERKAAKQASLQAQETKYKKQISDVKEKMLKDELSKTKEIIAKKESTFNKNMTKIDNDIADLIKENKTLKETRNLIENELTDDIIKKASKMQDDVFASKKSKQLFNASNKVMNQTKAYNDLLKKFYSEGLTDKELNKLATRIDKLEGSLKKSTAQLESKIKQIKASIDDKTINELKKINKSLSDTSDVGGKLALNQEKLKKTLEMKEITRSSFADTLDTYYDRVEKLESKIRGIDKSADAKINKELEKIAKQQSMLDNEPAQELFDSSFTAGLREFMNTELHRGTVAKNYNDALMEGCFENPNMFKYAENLEKLPDGTRKIPKGWEKVDGSAIYKQIDSFKDLITENSSTLVDFGNKVKGKAVYMPKELANILEVAPKAKNEAGAFVKFVNGWNNVFKRFKTLTPGFHLRNITGNASNMYLSGVPMKDIPVYYGKAIQALNGADDLIRKAAGGIDNLTKAEQKQYKLIQEFAETGFFKSGSKIQELEDIEKSIKKGSKNVPGKVLNKVSEVSMNMNTAMDNYSRMALYMYAKDNPGYVAKLGKESAADAVKFALFDPNNMTAAEKKYMRNIVPFYNFTKQNLLFQSSNIIKNTTKYKRLMKAINMTYDSLGENEYYQYQKEGFQIPTPFKDSKGNRLYMKTNLPLSDLGEYMENPVQRSLSSVTPIIKAPIEKVTGKDLFTGQDVNKKSSIDRIANYLGINTISTDVWRKIQAIQNSDLSDNEKWAEILRSMLQNVNEEKVQNNKLYQEMEYYQNQVNALKRQGIDVPTIKELTEQSKYNVNRLKKKRANNR